MTTAIEEEYAALYADEELRKIFGIIKWNKGKVKKMKKRHEIIRNGNVVIIRVWHYAGDNYSRSVIPYAKKVFKKEVPYISATCHGLFENEIDWDRDMSHYACNDVKFTLWY